MAQTGISIGAALGAYRITASLGAGGMGQVWRAFDTKLDRDVALKVLPEEFANDPDRMARFEREAKVLASLNHPNIAHLYGLEAAIPAETGTGSREPVSAADSGAGEPIHFLVMELAEGEDLAARIARGPISAEDAVLIALQIAEALEAAHEQGIVHRDLKPANIKVSEDGTVKVLDFGLAKAWEDEVGDASLSLSPTVTRHATAAGVILGTAAYMSPEQARGKRVDRRADIWAFGVVLWEMLTGKRLFEGETVSDVMAAVITREPDLDALPEETPPSARLVVQRCLDRELRQRLQWIGDARLELASSGDRDALVGTAPTARPVRSRRVPWMVAAVSAATACGLIAWTVLRGLGPSPVIAGSILAPENHQIRFYNEFSGSISVSPDGQWITFSAAEGDGPPSLWLRPVDSVEARSVAGTEGASFPFWSPDSRHIAFFADDHLKRVALDGSPAITLADAPNGRSGGWNRDGEILFSPTAQDPIFRVPSGGGDPVPVTELDADRGETTHRWATFLPDGRHFMFLAGSHSSQVDSDVHSIWVGELGSMDRRLLVSSRTNAVFASGFLLYVREEILLAQPFDPDRAVLVGDPIPVANGIGVDLPYYRADFAASTAGVLAYRRGSVRSEVQLHQADIDGNLSGPVGDPARILDVRLSPDGQRAALVISDPESGTDDIWIHDLNRNLRSRLTFGLLDESSPVWSPDGSRVAFVESSRAGQSEISVVDVDGANEPELIHSTEGDVFLVEWSPDGQWLLANANPLNDPAGFDIVALPAAGGDPIEVVATKFSERASGLSPDGRWLLYISEASQVRELFVTAFPRPGRRWQVAGNQVWTGLWRRPDEVFFIAPGPKAYTVPIRTGGDSVEIGQPVPRETLPNTTTGDIFTDGRSTLVAIRPEDEEVLPIIFMTNWTQTLEDR